MTRFVSRNQFPVRAASSFVVRQDLEGKLKATVKLVLPLLSQVAGANDETTLQVSMHDQFLDEQSGHNRLSRPRIVGKQKAQRLTREHGLVDGRYLVR